MDERAKLTEQELRDAAAEAGISPEELRQALVQRSGGAPAGPLARTSGTTAMQGYSAQTNLSVPPDQAAERVRGAIGKLVGHRGHRQGGGAIDILDDKTGMLYRIHTEADGQGGALVNVSTERSGGTMGLAAVMFGATSLGVIALGYLFFPLLFWLGVGMLMAGGAGLFLANQRIAGHHRQAQLVVSQALVDAEEALPAADAPPRALRPG